MPRYVVTMPDGKKYAINGPAGASEDEVIAAVQRRIGAAEPKTTFGGELKEAAKGIIPGAAGLLETAATGAAALLPEEQEMAVRAKASDLAGAAREAFKAAPGYEESVGRKFGEGLGSTAPFFALGPLGAAGRAGALGLGVGAGAGEARQRAETEGGEEAAQVRGVGAQRRLVVIQTRPCQLLFQMVVDIAAIPRACAKLCNRLEHRLVGHFQLQRLHCLVLAATDSTDARNKHGRSDGVALVAHAQRLSQHVEGEHLVVVDRARHEDAQL